MGGYGPPTTGFSKSLKFIGDRLQAEFGDRVAIEYVWNVMDLGYKAEDILRLVENGEITLGYQSSSYLTDRVPELGFVDLPFLFSRTMRRRAQRWTATRAPFSRARPKSASTIASSAGSRTASATSPTGCARCITPADLKDMRIRVLPSEIHRRTFELLGADAMRMDLTEAIAMIKAGTLDAQENPLANTVTYGVHQFPQIPHAHVAFLYFAADLPASRLVRRLAGRSQACDAGGGERVGRVPAQTRGRGA